MPERTDRSVLLVSYHFPPVQGSSGVHRIVACARYLADFGWEPIVLTIDERAYPRSDDANRSLVPDDVKVVRCFGLDTHRHLSFRGRYPSILATPDRWQTWIPSAVITGLRLIRKHKPSAIMSSFPIASANVIARALHKRTGIPWVADFRDPMILHNHPPPGPTRRAYTRIEQHAFQEAARVIVTTPGAAALYRDRYPGTAAGKIRIVENGVETEAFDRVRSDVVVDSPASRIRMLHSGMIYPEARDPRPLFNALSAMLKAGEIDHSNFELTFRASGQEAFISDEARRFGLEKIVFVRPPVNYEAAIREMLESDSLLLLQSEDCNRQIPAKAYEYLYCRKPILALTSPAGDTGTLLKEFSNCDVVALEDSVGIEPLVRDHLSKLRMHTWQFPDEDARQNLSRRARTELVARVLHEAVA